MQHIYLQVLNNFVCFPSTQVSNIHLDETPIRLCVTPKKELRISGFSDFPRIDCLLFRLVGTFDVRNSIT